MQKLLILFMLFACLSAYGQGAPDTYLLVETFRM